MGTVDSPSNLNSVHYGDSITGEVSYLDLHRNTLVDFRDTRHTSLQSREFQDPTNFIRNQISQTLHIGPTNRTPIPLPRRTYDSDRQNSGHGFKVFRDPASAGDSPNIPLRHPEISRGHINIGGTTVKLRNPQKLSNSLRSGRTMSWMEMPVGKMDSSSNELRRYSNIPANENIAATLKKLEHQRRLIESERNKTANRRDYIEGQKLLRNNLWMEELNAFQEQINAEFNSDDLGNVSDATASPSSITVVHPGFVHSSGNNNNNNRYGMTEASPAVSSVGASGRSSVNVTPTQQNPTFYSDENDGPTLGMMRNINSSISNSPLPRNSNVSPTPVVPSSSLPRAIQRNSIPQVRLSVPVISETGQEVYQSHNLLHQPHAHSVYERMDKLPPHDSIIPAKVQLPVPDPITEDLRLMSRNILGIPRNLTYDVSHGNIDGMLSDQGSEVHMSVTSRGENMRKVENSESNTKRPINETYDVSHSHKESMAQENHSKGMHESGVAPNTFNISQPKVIHSHDVANMTPEVNGQNVNSNNHVRENEFSRSTIPGNGKFPFPIAGCNTDIGDQENIDPHQLTRTSTLLSTYDSFAHKIAGVESNQSTPHKSPSSDNVFSSDAEDSGSILTKTADRNCRGGEGFELVEDATPNTVLAKKKEMFLLKQLKKEEELKRKRADREREEEKRKEEARMKQEEINAKREEEKQKRQQIFEDYKKRKMQQEENQRIRDMGDIIPSENTKKQPKNPINKPPAKAKRVLPYATHLAGSTSNMSEAGTVQTSDFDNRTQHLRSIKSKLDWETETLSSAVSSEYTGPKLYKEPSLKSNKHIIHNAICHCCLPGKVNEPTRRIAIEILESSDARHFMILFRDSKCQFRALYIYDPESEKLHKLSGNGPSTITPSMIETLYKYNSGRKSFTSLPSKTLSVSIDAVTIKNVLWQSSKRVMSVKK